MKSAKLLCFEDYILRDKVVAEKPCLITTMAELVVPFGLNILDDARTRVVVEQFNMFNNDHVCLIRNLLSFDLIVVHKKFKDPFELDISDKDFIFITHRKLVSVPPSLSRHLDVIPLVTVKEKEDENDTQGA